MSISITVAKCQYPISYRLTKSSVCMEKMHYSVPKATNKMQIYVCIMKGYVDIEIWNVHKLCKNKRNREEKVNEACDKLLVKIIVNGHLRKRKQNTFALFQIGAVEQKKFEIGQTKLPLFLSRAHEYFSVTVSAFTSNTQYLKVSLVNSC